MGAISAGGAGTTVGDTVGAAVGDTVGPTADSATLVGDAAAGESVGVVAGGDSALVGDTVARVSLR